MYIKDQKGQKIVVEIKPVEGIDYKLISKSKFFFNWETEKKRSVFKLTKLNSEEILGLISLIVIKKEKRIEINLLSVSKENRGRKQKYKGIAGALIAYASREAIKLFGHEACVSLTPKTELKAHYINKYQMLDAGRQVFLEGRFLTNIIKEYLS
ncbi:MAG: N-acetyltransferase [Bacteroidetes bacterium]|nr:N-acetyltransferase [Bacteroidota bacterium]